MIELDSKLLDQFKGYVVRKDVVRSVKGVPMFLSLYWNICLLILAARMMKKRFRKELIM